jgi:hypothetical protein
MAHARRALLEGGGVLACLLASGCGGVLDGSDAGDAGRSAPETGAACNALVNHAPVLALSLVSSDPPAGHGGTIVDGTYTMESAAYYTGAGGASGPSGTTSQVTIEVVKGTVQVASTSDGAGSGAMPPTHLTVTISTNGSDLTYEDTCPASATLHGSYTATPTSLTVMLPAQVGSSGSDRTLVETFARQ